MSKRLRSHSRSPSLDQDSISVSSITVNTTTPPSERNKLIDSDSNVLPEVMHCSLPPHPETLSFTSYEDYEVHYLQSHVNRCSECSKNFPTGHFLNIHIEENHDPLAAVRRARGDKTVSPRLQLNRFIESSLSKTTSMDALLKTASENAQPRRNDDYILSTSICFRRYGSRPKQRPFVPNAFYRPTTFTLLTMASINKLLCCDP